MPPAAVQVSRRPNHVPVFSHFHPHRKAKKPTHLSSKQLKGGVKSCQPNSWYIPLWPAWLRVSTIKQSFSYALHLNQRFSFLTMLDTRYLLQGTTRYLYCSKQCIQRSTCLAPVKAVEDELALSSRSPGICSHKTIPEFQTDIRKNVKSRTIQESFKRILEP